MIFQRLFQRQHMFGWEDTMDLVTGARLAEVWRWQMNSILVMRHRAGRNSVSIFESMDAQYSCTFLASCQGDLDTGIVHSKCRRLPLHAFWHFTVDMHSGGSVLYRTPIPFSLVLFPFSLFHFPFSDEHIRKGCLLRIPNSKFEIPVTGGNHLTDVSHIYM